MDVDVVWTGERLAALRLLSWGVAVACIYNLCACACLYVFYLEAKYGDEGDDTEFARLMKPIDHLWVAVVALLCIGLPLASCAITPFAYLWDAKLEITTWVYLRTLGYTMLYVYGGNFALAVPIFGIAAWWSGSKRFPWGAVMTAIGVVGGIASIVSLIIQVSM